MKKIMKKKNYLNANTICYTFYYSNRGWYSSKAREQEVFLVNPQESIASLTAQRIFRGNNFIHEHLQNPTINLNDFEEEKINAYFKAYESSVRQKENYDESIILKLINTAVKNYPFIESAHICYDFDMTKLPFSSFGNNYKKLPVYANLMEIFGKCLGNKSPTTPDDFFYFFLFGQKLNNSLDFNTPEDISKALNAIVVQLERSHAKKDKKTIFKYYDHARYYREKTDRHYICWDVPASELLQMTGFLAQFQEAYGDSVINDAFKITVVLKYKYYVMEAEAWSKLAVLKEFRNLTPGTNIIKENDELM